MDIIYSNHAREQMDRRRISRYEVEETINCPEVTAPGNPKPSIVLRRHVDGRFIKVVIVRKQQIKVITTAVVGEVG